MLKRGKLEEDMKTTKQEVKIAYENGKMDELLQYIITDGTKSDIVNALYLMLKNNSGEYEATFDSVPFSKGGKYKRHTTKLKTTQKWEIIYNENTGYFIKTSRTSNSANCPAVVIPKFYTEKGKEFHNSIIQKQIQDLTKNIL